MMISSMKQAINSTKSWLQMIMPSLTMFIFIGFAFFMGSMVILSIIPLYIGNKSVEKTQYILTTVRINNYTLHQNQILRKRDLARLISSFNTTDILTLDQARLAMNLSIQYALKQQLTASNNRDKFDIYILKIVTNTTNLNNISISLDFLIIYTRECRTCDKIRQSIIFKQLCSNNQLSTPIRVLIEYTNLSFILSNPLTFYTPYIPIENITIITQIVSTSQIINVVNNIESNQSTQTQVSNKFLANNYVLIVTTTQNNYIALLREVGTQNAANSNDGPISLTGAVTMYSGLTHTIKQQVQISNDSNAFNITINDIILQFWYLNSTVHVIVSFIIKFSTNCDNQCINQRNNQLQNLLNIQINIQPANLTDGQVSINKNNGSILYNYILSPIIANFTGTISHTIPPTLTAIY